MNRPSIALCCIMKNEAHNIGGLLQSVRGCFDEIHITDTGSTDNSVEFLEQINKHIDDKQPNWEGLPPIDIHHFDWVEDFSKARNYSFSFAKSDYICWLDLDDLLSDNKAFAHWRDTVMHSGHQWLATYNYNYNAKGEVDCKFIRERVVKNNFGFKWEYFVHEGLVLTENKKVWVQRVNTWTVNHRRSEVDRKNDHLRNIRIFEKNGVDTLPPRMLFYYGKELFENGMHKESGKPLLQAIQATNLDIHDRLLAMQYAAQSAYVAEAYTQAMSIAYNGIQLMPSRGELWSILGDIYSKTGQVNEAIQAYKTAMLCVPNDLGGIVVNYGHAYDEYPLNQLARLYLTVGDLKNAEITIKTVKEKGYSSSHDLEVNLNKLNGINRVPTDLPKCDDVIITCQPGGPIRNWDENSLKEKGHGGSETAAIEVARWIKQKTNRKVKIFQDRDVREVMPSGVEYIPAVDLLGYIHNVEPYRHIAWRHSARLTVAKSYVWCHDLQLPGGAASHNYDKVIALSEFHKNYLVETCGVPKEKIILGFNGINPDDFDSNPGPRDELKVIFSSSPDRGLIQAIDIVKKARSISGKDLTLHCFYGFDNMRKAGQGEWADAIEAKVKENSFVKYHGMVNKKTLMNHFQTGAVWLYPNDFIETYCITAIEALCAGCWPIVRNMGALKYTMKEALDKQMCDFMDVEVLSEASVGLWANTLVEAIIDKKWKKVDISKEKYSWERVAEFFIKEMEL